MTTQAGSEQAGSGTAATKGAGRRKKRGGRPAFGMLVLVVIVYRGGREVLDNVLQSRLGYFGVLLAAFVLYAVMGLWRYVQRRRVRARGDVEFTPEMVRAQIAESEMDAPTFEGDGTLLGASMVVVNQRPKVLEVYTEYELFGPDGAQLGSIRQLKQSRAKEIVRVLTPFDQYFTHHFDVYDVHGQPVLRITRPRKLFKTRVHVFTGDDLFIGTLQQQNMFWKIRFHITAANGEVVGQLRAENLRAWDFEVYDAYGQQVAEVLKSWEGWMHTAFTRADRYVVRIDHPQVDPLRSLTMAAALSIDLALKQDARGIG